MKVSTIASVCLLCSSLACGENPFLSRDFWETATVENVNSAVATGADANAVDAKGFTALMFAAEVNPDPDVVERLVTLGADINAEDKSGITVLLVAAGKNPNPEMVERLVKLGADVNAHIENGWTALTMAAGRNPNPEVVERLLKLGADASYKPAIGLSVLDWANRNRSLRGTKAYQMLRDAETLVRKEKPFLFEKFWQTATVEDVNSALADGADINADIENGWPALMIAARFNPNPEVIERLLELGAEVSPGIMQMAKMNEALKGTRAYQNLHDAETAVSRKMPSNLSPEFWGTTSVEDIEAALTDEPDINARIGPYGGTILMYAAMKGSPEVIERLVSLGANVHALDAHGMTALMAAAGNTNPDVVEQLVKLGADVNAREALLGRTALMFAAEGNANPDVVERLVKLGSDINARDEFGKRTALLWAARFTSSPEVIARLVKLGADISYEDGVGQNALELVMENKRLKEAKSEAYKILEEAVKKVE